MNRNMIKKMRSQYRNSRRRVTEGEVEQSEVVIAARDISDQLNDIIEDLGKIAAKVMTTLRDKTTTQFGKDAYDRLESSFSDGVGQAVDAITELKSSVEGVVEELEGGIGTSGGSFGGPDSFSVGDTGDEFGDFDMGDEGEFGDLEGMGDFGDEGDMGDFGDTDFDMDAGDEGDFDLDGEDFDFDDNDEVDVTGGKERDKKNKKDAKENANRRRRGFKKPRPFGRKVFENESDWYVLEVLDHGSYVIAGVFASEESAKKAVESWKNNRKKFGERKFTVVDHHTLSLIDILEEKYDISKNRKDGHGAFGRKDRTDENLGDMVRSTGQLVDRQFDRVRRAVQRNPDSYMDWWPAFMRELKIVAGEDEEISSVENFENGFQAVVIFNSSEIEHEKGRAEEKIRDCITTVMQKLGYNISATMKFKSPEGPVVVGDFYDVAKFRGDHVGFYCHVNNNYEGNSFQMLWGTINGKKAHNLSMTNGVEDHNESVDPIIKETESILERLNRI